MMLQSLFRWLTRLSHENQISYCDEWIHKKIIHWVSAFTKIHTQGKKKCFLTFLINVGKKELIQNDTRKPRAFYLFTIKFNLKRIFIKKDTIFFFFWNLQFRWVFFFSTIKNHNPNMKLNDKKKMKLCSKLALTENHTERLEWGGWGSIELFMLISCAHLLTGEKVIRR